MIQLKNEFIFCFIFISSFGCQTNKIFEMKTDVAKKLNTISIDSNRVIQECYFLNATEENNWRHSYLIHMLNQKDEVITATYPITLDKEACNEHLKKVEKILKKDSTVTLCIRDILEKDSRPDPIPEIVDFGSLGKFFSPYDFLTFDRICNSKDCVSISDTWLTTCPEFKNGRSN